MKYLILLLIPLLFFAQKKKGLPLPDYKITLNLNNKIKYLQLQKNGTQGIAVIIPAKIDTIRIPLQSIKINIKIIFQTSEGKLITPEDNYTKYLSKFGYTIVKNDYNIKRYDKNLKIKFFLPFYALKIPQGNHKILIKLKSITAENNIPVQIKGTTSYEIKINKPPTQKVFACIGSVEVVPYDSLGNAWDEGMFSEIEERPDLSVAIYTSEIRAKFPTTKNRYFYDFNKCSPEITISKGDTPKLLLIDDDENGFQIIDKFILTEKVLQEITFPYEKVENTTRWKITKADIY